MNPENNWAKWEQRFSYLIKPLAAGTETAGEFEEFGEMLLQVTIFWERRLGSNEEDLGNHAGVVWRKLRDPKFSEGDIDVPNFAAKLRAQLDPVSRYLNTVLPKATHEKLARYKAIGADPDLEEALVRVLNKVLDDEEFYEVERFSGLALSPEAQEMLARKLHERDVVRLNSLLLTDAYPGEIAARLKNHLNEMAELPNRHAWKRFVRVIENTVRDEFRRERRYRELVHQLEAPPDGDNEGSLFESVTADPSAGPESLAMLNHDWTRLEAILRRYHHQGNVMVYWEWTFGSRITDIAEQHSVPDATIQSAVSRVQEFVLKTTLGEERLRVEKILAGYPHPGHPPIFREWLDGKNIIVIAEQKGLMKREVRTAIQAVIRFISCH